MPAALPQPDPARQARPGAFPRRLGPVGLAAHALCGLLASGAVAAPGEAPPAQNSAFSLACLRTASSHGAGCMDEDGARRLLLEARRRTSLRPAPGPRPIDLAPPAEALWQQPLLVWQGTGATDPLPAAHAAILGRYLWRGGLLLVDAAEPEGSAGRQAFLRGVHQSLELALGAHEPSPIDPTDVLHRSFYLLGGANDPRPRASGVRLGERWAVVYSPEPWLAALAQRPDGTWVHAVADDGAQRERRLRAALNWLMYAFCLDYKNDQVHLPYLLERRAP